LNVAGLPGWIRSGSYESATGVAVRVRVSGRFTVLTVNGVDVYFSRLSGRLDGVGVTAARDCTSSEAPAAVPDSVLFGWPPPPS
jgi:hypothetical protein